MTVSLTATPIPAGTPAPYVDVSASSFDVGSVSVTVWRIVGGRSYPVRGLVGQSASGSVSGRDFEAPLGVVSSYRVQMLDADGGLVAWSATVDATLPPAVGGFWVHNPLDVSTSLFLPILYGDAGVLSRPIDVETFRVVGRSAPVALFNPRHALEQLVLDTYTATDAEALAFDALFGGYDDLATIPILCFRTPLKLRIPPTFFGLVKAPQQLPFDVHTGGTIARWSLVADEVSPPPTALIETQLDYADFTGFYADYAAFTAAYADYQAAQKDYSIAGTA